MSLLNMAPQMNALNLTKEIMLSWKEVGSFLGFIRGNDIHVSSSSRIEQYALQFENCTLSLDLLANTRTNTQLVQSFKIEN